MIHVFAEPAQSHINASPAGFPPPSPLSHRINILFQNEIPKRMPLQPFHHLLPPDDCHQHQRKFVHRRVYKKGMPIRRPNSLGGNQPMETNRSGHRTLAFCSPVAPGQGIRLATLVFPIRQVNFERCVNPESATIDRLRQLGFAYACQRHHLS